MRRRRKEKEETNKQKEYLNCLSFPLSVFHPKRRFQANHKTRRLTLGFTCQKLYLISVGKREIYWKIIWLFHVIKAKQTTRKGRSS